MSYSGYDIEDAIIMNKASLDRGFGRCVVLRKYGAVLKKHQNRSSDLLAPPSIPPGQAGSPECLAQHPVCFAHTVCAGFSACACAMEPPNQLSPDAHVRDLTAS